MQKAFTGKSYSMSFTHLIPELLKTVREASEAILKIYHHAADFGVENKSDKSPVTTADKAANEIICRRLEALSIKYPIISEESKQLPYELRKEWEYCWLVDPLDGTKEFIKRNDEFTINIALIEKNKPVLGMIYIPCLQEAYWAVKGEGAYMLKKGIQQVLAVAEFRETDENLNIVCSRSHMNSATLAFMDKYHEPNIVSVGSSLKFMMLAKGEAHLYPKIGHTSEWDTAAAQIILEEAGGQILHFDTLQPLFYNKEDLLNPWFLAMGRVKGDKL